MKPRKPKLPKNVLKFFQATGAEGGKARAANQSKEKIVEWAAKGGKARAAKYSAEQLRNWARLGGRPPKRNKKGAE